MIVNFINCSSDGFSIMDIDELFFINGGSVKITTSGTTTITKTKTVTDKETGESHSETSVKEKTFSYDTYK